MFLLISSFMVYLLVFIIGLSIGSFLNVLIYRLPKEKSVVKGRSKCLHCQKKIKWYDLLPVISFIVLKGKCRSCKKKISWQYPLIELVSGLLFVFVFYYHFDLVVVDPVIRFIKSLIFVSALIVVFMIDLKKYLILNKVTYSITIFAIIINIYIYSVLGSLSYFFVIKNLLISMLIGGGFFFLQYVLTKKKGVGFGDVKMGVMMGAMLMFLDKLVVALLISYVLGAIISLSLIALKKKTFKSQMPMGVFLAVGTLISLFFCEKIITWYLS